MSRKRYVEVTVLGLSRAERIALLQGCLQNIDTVRFNPDGTSFLVKYPEGRARPSQLPAIGFLTHTEALVLSDTWDAQLDTPRPQTTRSSP